MGKAKGLLGLFASCAIVFFSGGCVVVLALVVWRLMARDVGTSLYAWTAMLGVSLGGMCLGGRLGGRMADRYHARRVLAVLYALLSAACVGIVILSHLLGGWIWLWELSWPVHVCLHVAIVLCLPSLLLGTIGPVQFKTMLDLGLAPGRTVGAMFTWAGAGAIIGTLLAGLYVIPRFDSVTIIWAIGAAMLGVALLYWISCWAFYLWAMIFGALATMGMAPAQWACEAGVAAHLREPNDPGLIYRRQTAYDYLTVRRLAERPDRRAFEQGQRMPVEVTIGDIVSSQSFEAEICAGLTKGLNTGKVSPAMMLIGARGYVLARYLQSSWPAGRVTVVEADPGVTRVAAETLGLESDTPIETVNADGRYHVEQLIRQDQAGVYDFIYQDLAADCEVPFQLVTTEFNAKIAHLLADDGLYMLTLVDTFETGRFLGAVVETLEQAFPHVHVIGHKIARPSWPEPFVVVATRRAFDPAALLPAGDAHAVFRLLDESDITHLKDTSDGLILTDDLAPVDTLLAPVAWRLGPKKLASRYLCQGRMLRDQKSYDLSAEAFARVAELDPLLSVCAWNAIGQMRLAQEDWPAAEVAFRNAIRLRDEMDLRRTEIGSVHMNLGMLLRRLNRAAQAAEQWKLAADWFRVDLERSPDQAVEWERLGDTLVLTGDLKEASEAFSRAVALEPENAAHYRKLAKALETQRRYDEAIAVARRHIELLKARGAREEALRVGHYVELLEYERVKQKQ